MRTAFHTDAMYLRHVMPDGHPERVERIEAMLRVAARTDALGVALLPARRRASREELTLVHTGAYIDAIASTAGRRESMLDPDTYTSSDSYEVALYACGGVLDLVDRVMEGEIDHAFAAIRPPGHHAESRRAMGFCLFNNIAVGAAHALVRHGLERIMVIDWDVHHGNGTQEAFWNDPRVLYLSLHQYPFYPGTGAFDETGGRDAPGHTVNIPMPAGFGDDEWTAAFRRVVAPVARAYAPQLVMLSAGFDAHERDPLADMRVTDAGFAAMADAVVGIAREHARGRLVATLEGGYDLRVLESNVEMVLRRMAGDETSPARDRGEGRFGGVYAQVKTAHASHWPL
jgi:acetoin utilization deacetylase AcuC-like enzyme